MDSNENAAPGNFFINKGMQMYKIFFDNLIFSVLGLLFGGFGLYVALYIIDSSLTNVGYPLGVKEFSFGENFYTVLIAWIVLSILLAVILTFKKMKDMEEGDIDFTGHTRG